ncbi:hypothetical protein [Francisella uliginis]|uniref:Uncharacterized protein n=1 Tax=Francisella uliginis TaxID=573570 RepID=A0A1L4BPT1_9GAMM|nr:hypothetical protein [Francisella uliginis]API85844.1 hypothetical protein F7310_00065 [Francisella uliginis]
MSEPIRLHGYNWLDIDKNRGEHWYPEVSKKELEDCIKVSKNLLHNIPLEFIRFLEEDRFEFVKSIHKTSCEILLQRHFISK